jgi:membrane fusion protein, multidrug efflux system
MTRRMIIMLILVGLVLGGIFGFEAFRTKMIKQYLASMGAQPQTVATTKAGTDDWRPHLEAVGSLKAVKGADLAFEVPGIVDSISFNAGDDAQTGATLVRLKADDDIARLHSLEATAELAAITYQRDEKQFRVQAVAQATLDADAANLKNARAQVAQQQAVVDKKTLKAPFAGHLGIRNIDLGQFVNSGTAVVTLQALDPIYVDFTLPQQALAQVKTGQAVVLHVDTYPDQTFPGEITAIDPKVDAASRNVRLRATLRNADHRLLPGMYAKVEIDIGAPTRYVTLPQTAIAFNPYGSTVYLVEEQGKDAKGQPELVARQAFVTTGPTRGDQVAVLKGVNAGDTVVSAGQMKLRNGVKVVVNNQVQPSNEANPKILDQ